MSAVALLDTSIFVAQEVGRVVDATSLPDEGSVSVVTIAELEACVLAAADVVTRARRAKTAREIELVWDGTALIARNDPKAYAALLTVLRDVEAERDDLHITVIER